MQDSEHTWSGITYRVAIAVFGLSLALVAFESGVTVSDTPNLPDASWLTKLYYALGLFVLGGLDLGVPESGPLWGQAMLWVAYFGCPALATAAIAEGLGRLLRAQSDDLGELRDHAVVVGSGDVARLYIESLTDDDRQAHDILLVTPEATSPLAAEHDPADGLRQVTGDPTSGRFAERASLREATRIFLLSEDDVANVEASLFLIEELGVSPSRLVVHLSDIALKRDIEDRSVLPPGLALFNSHEIAAEHLLDEKIGSFFRETDYSDEVVLAGFGRFGQSMLERLDAMLPGEFRSVVLLDRRASPKYRLFREQVDLDGTYDVETIDGDMRDPKNWERAIDFLSEATEEPLVVLGADDDAVNLQVALWLQQKVPEASLFVRTIGITHLADAMAAHRRFEIENVHRRMKDYMRASSNFRLEGGSPGIFRTLTGGS